MIVLWLVRCKETNISSATATRDSRMISAAKGSIFVLTAIPLHPRLDDQVADPIQARSLARVDDSGRSLFLHDRGALHLFITAQSRALIERRVVDPVLIEVDFPSTLARAAARGGGSKCGQVGVGHSHQARQVQVDELHRSIDPKHKRALV